ncbi:hypothetical protein VTO58DRAFT_107149 [Aureobasidium pullulans]
MASDTEAPVLQRQKEKSAEQGMVASCAALGGLENPRLHAPATVEKAKSKTRLEYEVESRSAIQMDLIIEPDGGVKCLSLIVLVLASKQQIDHTCFSFSSASIISQAGRCSIRRIYCIIDQDHLSP